MIRVTHVVQSLDPAWGGIARVLPELALRLRAGRIESTIATLTGGRYGRPPPIDLEVRAYSASAGRLGRSRAFAEAVGALVQSADVVHLHGLWTHQNWCAGSAARAVARPYVMTPHSMLMPWAWRRSWWKKRPAGWLFEHRNLRRAAMLHALSPGEAEHMRTLKFNPKIVVIPNGVDLGEFAAPREALAAGAAALEARHPALAGRRWLLFGSRIHAQKGVRPLLEGWLDVACGAARDEAASWQLVIAGTDEVGLQAELEAVAARRGGRERVTSVGLLDRPALAAAMARAEFLVQPSLSEGLSLSILEALACGLPVLISPACNMPEVAEEGAGIVVQPRREEIAAALRRIVSMRPESLADLSQKARRLADRFAWDGLIPQYVSLYEGLRRSPR